MREDSRGHGGTPLVSVVVPVYNCAPFIGEALESVYRQTYDHWEVIVVDDGSTDGTRAALAPHMSRIRYLYQANRGPSVARNTGVRQARGQLIAFLDGDDVWLPEKLELQVRVMRRWPECGFVFTDGTAFTTDRVLQESLLSRHLDSWIEASTTDDPLVTKGCLVRQLTLRNVVASTSSVMVRRDCFESVGGFDRRFVGPEDYDLWLKLARRHPVALVRRCLFMYRWHDDSLSGSMGDRFHRWAEGSLMVMEEHLPLASSDVRASLRAEMARLYWSCARSYFDRDQFRDARRMLRGCLSHDSMSVPALVFLVASGLGAPFIHPARRVKQGLKRLLGAGRGMSP